MHPTGKTGDLKIKHGSQISKVEGRDLLSGDVKFFGVRGGESKYISLHTYYCCSLTVGIIQAE